MDKSEQTIYVPNNLISFSRRTWKNAILNDRLFLISMDLNMRDVTIGYRVFYYLWSADIWFGRLPFLKFIVAVNMLVWILQFVL